MSALNPIQLHLEPELAVAAWKATYNLDNELVALCNSTGDGSEQRKWFDQQSIITISATCLGTALIICVALYTRKHCECTWNGSAIVDESAKDQVDLLKLEQMISSALDAKEVARAHHDQAGNDHQDPTFGMADIGPPTRREGGRASMMSDVVIETPEDDVEEGETTN